MQRMRSNSHRKEEAMNIRIWPDGTWQFADEELDLFMSDDFKTLEVPYNVYDIDAWIKDNSL